MKKLRVTRINYVGSKEGHEDRRCKTERHHLLQKNTLMGRTGNH